MGFSDKCPCQHRKSSNRPWAPFLFVSWCLQQKPKQHSNNRRNESHVDTRSFFGGDFPCRFCVRKSERTWSIEARLWGSKFGPRHELIEEGKKWCVNETFGLCNRTRIYNDIYIWYIYMYVSMNLENETYGIWVNINGQSSGIMNQKHCETLRVQFL